MANLNQIACLEDVKNTGFGDCVLQLSAVRGAFLVPKKKVFAQADLVDIITTLQTAAAAASKSDRIFPVPGFEVITDGSADPTYDTLASGRKIPVQEGNYDWTFQFYDGGLCLNKKLRSFNHTSYSALFYDSNFRLFGTKKNDSTGAAGLAGIPLDVLYTYPWKANDFSKAIIYRINFSFKPNYVNEDIAFVDAGSDVQSVTGLQDIVLSEKAVNAGGVFHLGAQTGCAGTDLYGEFGDDLASSDLWKFTNAAGAELTITSVAKDDNDGGWTVTLDKTDTDYPATGATIYATLADPTTLSAAGVSGYEAGSLAIKVNA